MTADVARFERLLQKVEGIADGDGWGAPPALYVIYDREVTETAEVFDSTMAAHPALGPATRLGGYAAQPMASAEWFPSLPPGAALRRFALNLAYAGNRNEVQIVRQWLRRAGVLGFACCYEADGVAELTRGDVARLVLDEFDHVAQYPGAADYRIVQGQDLQSRQYQVVRLRGRPAEVNAYPVSAAGEIATVLALLCDVITDTVPADLREAYPTLRQIYG